MIRQSFALALAFAVSTTAAAQQPPAPAIGITEIAALAKAEAAIAKARDSTNAQLAMARNKTTSAQQSLREKLMVQTAEALKSNGLTDADYRLRTYVVSTDNAARKIYDSVMVAVTGAPLPGMAPAVAAKPVMAVPAGPVGAHIGHVVNAWGDTPMGAGLLPTAVGEARVAATHAGLAGRQPTNLEYMKTHAGHVINAIDPTIVTTGPGLGYGLKKAANLAATHIELAAGTPGASPNVINHAKHIATSARNTVARADQILALARQVQAATTAAEAAGFVAQMASLCEQLIAGADANADGRITWEAGEGGLQIAEDHVKLMLAAEGQR